MMKGYAPLPLTIELIPDADQGGFTARLPDIPAYGEGETENAAIDDLKETIRGYIDTFGLEDALCRVVRPALRRVPLTPPVLFTAEALHTNSEYNDLMQTTLAARAAARP